MLEPFGEASSDILEYILSIKSLGWTYCCHFSGVSASNPMKIRSVLTEISKKVLPESTDCSIVSAIVVVLKSRDSLSCLIKLS